MDNRLYYTLGYWNGGKYRLLWSQIFHDAYKDVIRSESYNFIHMFGEKSFAIESTLLYMADAFLGEEDILSRKYLKEEEKNNFRIKLEKMYQIGQEEQIYKYNPFTDENETSFINIGKDDAIEYLKDVLDCEKV